MNLLAIRTQFVKISGRYDLVVDAVDFEDNGADFYINAGQKYLDRMDTSRKARARVFESIVLGSWYAIFQLCRAVEEVWCTNSSGEKWKLEKIDYKTLWQAYAEDPANLDSGDPLYYCPIYLRTVPEVADTLTIDSFGSTVYHESRDHFTYNGMIFMPPAQGSYTLEIRGLFYTPELVNETDETYWSVVQPQALIMAACRQLEIMYRNSEGAKDWENSIALEMRGIDFDEVAQDIAEIDQMEG